MSKTLVDWSASKPNWSVPWKEEGCIFTHHKLKVYAKALAFCASVDRWLPKWSPRHAVTDQLGRASESLVLNLADGSRLRGPSAKAQALDCALGSTLECAACLDIASIKELIEDAEFSRQKACLWEMTLMLIALRKSWIAGEMREEPIEYYAEPNVPKSVHRFHHERLDVYQTGLVFVRWFSARSGTQELSQRLARRIDQAATGLVLNIAEGNGRYARLDRIRFLKLAATATVKAAVYLDLWGQTASPTPLETTSGQEYLQKIMAMLEKMILD